MLTYFERLIYVEARDTRKAYEIAKNMAYIVFEAEGYISESATFFYYTLIETSACGKNGSNKKKGTYLCEIDTLQSNFND